MRALPCCGQDVDRNIFSTITTNLEDLLRTVMKRHRCPPAVLFCVHVVCVVVFVLPVRLCMERDSFCPCLCVCVCVSSAGTGENADETIEQLSLVSAYRMLVCPYMSLRLKVIPYQCVRLFRVFTLAFIS